MRRIKLDFHPQRFLFVRSFICLFACIFASIYNHHESNWSSNLFIQSVGVSLSVDSIYVRLRLFTRHLKFQLNFFLSISDWTLHFVRECRSPPTSHSLLLLVCVQRTHEVLCSCLCVRACAFSSFIELMKRALKIIQWENSIRNQQQHQRKSSSLRQKENIVHIRPITLGEILKNVLCCAVLWSDVMYMPCTWYHFTSVMNLQLIFLMKFRKTARFFSQKIQVYQSKQVNSSHFILSMLSLSRF